MAIEAAKQLANPEKSIKAFVIKNASFHSALIIRPTLSTGTEVNFYMRPLKSQDEKESGWHDFRLYTNDSWYENCNGSIQIIYESSNVELGIDKGYEERTWHENLRCSYQEALRSCSSISEVNQAYDQLYKNGYNYGPTFRAVDSIFHNGLDCAVSEVRTYQFPPKTYRKHVIHPTTLDCLFQGILFAGTAGGTKRIKTAIPTHFDKIWISNKGLSHPEEEKLRVFSNFSIFGTREINASIVGLNSSAQEVLIEVDGFRATEVVSSADDADEAFHTTLTSPLCHNIDWRPDIGFLSDVQIRDFVERKQSLRSMSKPTTFYDDIDFYTTACIKRALRCIDLQKEPVLQFKHHINKYILWMRHRMELLEIQDGPNWKPQLDDDSCLEERATRISLANKQGKFYTTVGQNLYQLLTGEVDALDLLFRQDLVKDHYYELVSILH